MTGVKVEYADGADLGGRRCLQSSYLEGEASCQLKLTNTSVEPSNLAKIAVALAAVWEIKVWSVGYVEGVAMQFQSSAFGNLEILLHSDVVSSVAGTADLVPSERSHARVYGVSRPIGCQGGRKIGAGEGRGVKPSAANALPIVNRLDEVGPVAGIGTAFCGDINWLPGLKKKDVVELPSTDHGIEGAGSVRGESLSASEGQKRDKRTTEDLPLILIRIAIVGFRVVIERPKGN